MAKGILLVETRPSSPETAADYNTWYDEVHLPEMLAIDGFTSARRFAANEGPSSIAIYEIDVDIPTARANLQAAQAAGRMSTPVGVQLDPPPSIRYFAVAD